MRGDLVTVALPGDLGKPGPALVIQADWFEAHTSVTVLPVTLRPDTDNGLQKPLQVMVDKAMTVQRNKLGPAFGRIDADTLVEVERCLAVFLGIGK